MKWGAPYFTYINLYNIIKVSNYLFVLSTYTKALEIFLYFSSSLSYSLLHRHMRGRGGARAFFLGFVGFKMSNLGVGSEELVQNDVVLAFYFILFKEQTPKRRCFGLHKKKKKKKSPRFGCVLLCNSLPSKKEKKKN